jgi:hypothetical protein
MESYKLNSNKILLIARWVGLVLIVLGWFQIVPLMFGWVGFGIAGIAFLLEAKYKKKVSHPTTDENPE